MRSKSIGEPQVVYLKCEIGRAGHLDLSFFSAILFLPPKRSQPYLETLMNPLVG